MTAIYNFRVNHWVYQIEELDFYCSWERVNNFSFPGDISPLAQGSDAGSVCGARTDCTGPHRSFQQASCNLLSPTGSYSILDGIPRCLSPAPSDPFPSGRSMLSNGSHISGSTSSLDSDASGSTVVSSDSYPVNERFPYIHYDIACSRRPEVEARKAEKRSCSPSPARQENECILSLERRLVPSCLLLST